MSKRDPNEPDPAAGRPVTAADETTTDKPAVEESEERASTPFDHPFFLPALLIGFTLWFGYDGWLNADFDPQWVSFNRWGFFVLLALAAYFTFQSVRETRGGK